MPRRVRCFLRFELRSAKKNADAAVYRVETIEETVERQVAPTRFYLVLVGIFALLAASLAAVGL